MKKALLMGVSGAAMIVGVSAAFAGPVTITAGQSGTQTSNPVQTLGATQNTTANGGNGAGAAAAASSGGGAGGAGGPGGGAGATTTATGFGSLDGGQTATATGGSAGAGGAGGNGAAAAAADAARGGDGGSATQHQRGTQGVAQLSSQSQTITVSDSETASGDKSTVVDGTGNVVTAHSAIATGAAALAANNGGSNVAALGAGSFAAGHDVVWMQNNTTMSATNTVGGISLSSGNANGGNARGGDLTPDQTALTGNLGRAGDATASNTDTYSGNGGRGGNGTAVSANVGLQGALSANKSEGGDGKAYSDAYGSSKSASVGVSGAAALAGNLGGAKNSSRASSNGQSDSLIPTVLTRGDNHHGQQPSSNQATASGKAVNHQDAASWAKAWTQPIAKSDTNAQSAALGTGGNGGAIDSKTGNYADQKAGSAASGGNGGNSGDAYAYAKGLGGDLSQTAGSSQIINAATGATQGGNGGDTSVHFGSGNIGAISLGTMSGIANIAQNTGLSANQFSSFSINANTKF